MTEILQADTRTSKANGRNSNEMLIFLMVVLPWTKTSSIKKSLLWYLKPMNTVKSRAVDRSTIQFSTILGVLKK